MPGRQLNIRFTEEQSEVLAAAAVIQGVSLPNLVRPVINDLVEGLRQDTAVVGLLSLRRDRQRAAEAGRDSLS
jgi:hypothetical protein